MSADKAVMEASAGAETVQETTGVPVTSRQRIPMSIPVPRMAVPEIPGFKLRWMLGEPGRIDRAIQGGYEFVGKDEVKLNNRDMLGSNSAENGNTDLGNRVSINAGGDIGPDGQAVRLYLMKIKVEWWLEDQKAKVGKGSRIDGVRRALMGGKMPQGEAVRAEDAQQVYLGKRTKLPKFLDPDFNPTS